MGLYLIIGLCFEFFVKSIKKQGEKLLTIMLLSSPELRVGIGQGVLEVDRLQLAVLAAPNVLKQGTKVISQT